MNWVRVLTALLIIGLLVPYIPVGFWFEPPTGSMRPTSTGCSITVYGPATPSEGDVLWYWRSDNSIISHRVVDITDEGYLIKGDNLDEPDGIISRDKVHAEVYYNVGLGVSRQDCISVMAPIYNAYYTVLGSDRTFEDARVN